MGKKGASEIIGWVLLVGLSISLAIMVITWAKQQAQGTSEYIITSVEGDVRCSEVAMKAFIVDPPCQDINVSNTGYFTIVEIAARHQFGTQNFPVNLLPQQDSKRLNIQIPSQVELIPLVSSADGLLGCADRKIILTC